MGQRRAIENQGTGKLTHTRSSHACDMGQNGSLGRPKAAGSEHRIIELRNTAIGFAERGTVAPVGLRDPERGLSKLRPLGVLALLCCSIRLNASSYLVRLQLVDINKWRNGGIGEYAGRVVAHGIVFSSTRFFRILETRRSESLCTF
jgi:hypothetical protein